MRIDAARPMAAWVAVLATPDGPLLAPHGDGGTRLFDARTKAARGTWPALARAAASLPGRTLLLAAGVAGPRRFDLAAGAELPPVADRAEVWDVAVAPLPDGRVVLAGAGPGGLHRWDAATGARLGRPPLLGPPLRAVVPALRPGGVTLIGGGEDGTLYRADAAAGEPLRPPQPTAAPALQGLALAPTGREMLVGCDWDGSVHRWDPHTGDVIGEPIPVPAPARLAGCFAGRFDRPCALLLTAGDRYDAAVAVDLERGERVAVPARTRAVFSLDGVTLAVLVHPGGQLTAEPLYGPA
ncbi:WD40 repeat domain-containing protein [Dactylosporangium sp. CA-139114]|uniref:WD40 repeat domain-containing protein n=1 Tax=Dactylosporangium sp. CA-139114 TaxID=3239931 RepID=UPI003D96623A